jgi:hypothetical protein
MVWDRYSDIDLAVLVGDETRLEAVYADWWDRLHTLFNPVDAFKEPSQHLYGLLLDRYMELDISFQGESGLYERKPNWTILFDRRGVIPSLMKPREKPAGRPSRGAREEDTGLMVLRPTLRQLHTEGAATAGKLLHQLPKGRGHLNGGAEQRA